MFQWGRRVILFCLLTNVYKFHLLRKSPFITQKSTFGRENSPRNKFIRPKPHVYTAKVIFTKINLLDQNPTFTLQKSLSKYTI